MGQKYKRIAITVIRRGGDVGPEVRQKEKEETPEDLSYTPGMLKKHQILLADNGWEIECGSPLEICYTETGDRATGLAAKLVIEQLHGEDKTIPPKPNFMPGYYLHVASGVLYKATKLQLHSEELEWYVDYTSTDGEDWTRPFSMWNEIVNGKPRFKFVSNDHKVG